MPWPSWVCLSAHWIWNCVSMGLEGWLYEKTNFCELYLSSGLRPSLACFRCRTMVEFYFRTDCFSTASMVYTLSFALGDSKCWFWKQPLPMLHFSLAARRNPRHAGSKVANLKRWLIKGSFEFAPKSTGILQQARTNDSNFMTGKYLRNAYCCL